MTRNPLFVLCSGAFLIGLSFAWAFYAPNTFAAGQLNPLVQTNADNQICPLSESQQERARQAWADLDRMVRSDPPRCINCHGRMNPFVDGTKHPGGELTFLHDKKGRRDLLATRQTQCLFCHEAPWQAPFGKDLWHFQNTVQLCTHIRKEFDTAEALQSHLRSDPLADLAFEGKRALNDVGQAIYEGEFGRPPVPEPPSFTRGDLTLLASLWTDAMGGKFVGGPTCGCEPHHYVLELTLDLGWKAETSFASCEAKSHAELRIPISIKDDGSFTGQATLDRPSEGTCTASQGEGDTHSGTYMGEVWKVEGNLEVDSRGLVSKILGKFTVNTPSISYTIVGSNSGLTVVQDYPGGVWSREFELSGLLGESKTLDVKGLIPGATLWTSVGTIKVTIVEDTK